MLFFPNGLKKILISLIKKGLSRLSLSVVLVQQRKTTRRQQRIPQKFSASEQIPYFCPPFKIAGITMRNEKHLEVFDIPIQKLKNGEHTFTFQITDAFWEHFEHPDIQKGEFEVKLKLEKSDRVLNLDFDIVGTVNLICDRSLRGFVEKIRLQEHVLFKFGQNHEELDVSVFEIPYDAERINIAQLLYDLIGVAVPMKKIHPELRDETDEELDEDGFLIYSSQADEDTTEETIADPRWAALKNLKNKN